MAPADNTPDFDKMTPEEIMTWMESLAKKQGANEGFTTSADMQIADIDPTSVVIDEPGYVPSEGKMKGQKIESVNNFKTGADAPPATPTPAPVAEELPPPPQEIFEDTVIETVAEQPAADLSSILADFEPAPAIEEPAADLQGSMSWLESLAADQGVEFPSLDFSSIADDLAPSTPPEPVANPVDWLENLAQSEGVFAENEAPPPEAAAGGDPMSWLESLAKRQGANEDELMTDADVDIPLPETISEDGPGYTDYSFDMPGTPAKIGTGEHTAVAAEPAKELEPAALEDPSAWLDSLASGQVFDNTLPTDENVSAETKMSDSEIQSALARGEVVPHDQMEAWMNRQLEIGSQRDEPEELSAYDPDAPAVPAEIPDWLIDQVGQAPPVDESPKAPAISEPPPLLDAIFEPPAVADMPDWLKDEPESSELDSIFANTLEQDNPFAAPPAQETFAPPPPAPEPIIAQTMTSDEINANDPWVEAFELEYKERQSSGETATPVTASETSLLELEDANLEAETELPVGELEDVPDWLGGMVSDEEADAIPADIPDWLQEDFNNTQQPEPTAAEAPVTISAEVPDWLQTVDVEPAEIPDWLKSTLGTSEQVVVAQESTPAEAAALVPVPAVQSQTALVPPPRVTGYSPAPVPVQAGQIDVQATLNEARSKANVNDIDASLQQYELLIRANVELDTVVGDVTKLMEKFKTTPAVYRVLGDGLMRQGKLQIALDTYRKALNQL